MRHWTITLCGLVASSVASTTADAGWFCRSRCTSQYYYAEPCCSSYVSSTPHLACEPLCTDCPTGCCEETTICSTCEEGVSTTSRGATVQEEIDQIRIQIGDLQERVQALEADAQ